MRLTKYGHACLLIEEGDAAVLVDPGIYSSGFERLRNLSAVLVTHAHPDHVDEARLEALLGANPAAVLLADTGTAASLAPARTMDAVRAGDERDVHGLSISVWGDVHATVHPDIPAIPNVGYLLGGRLFHPGDSLVRPDGPVDVLALPVGGPWLKIGEAIDYLRAVSPRIVVPIHEAVLARPETHFRFLRQLAPAGTQVIIPAEAETVDV